MRKFLLVATFALASVAVAAALQTPSDRERGQPQNHPAKPDLAAGEQKTGTEQAPFVVKVVPGAEAEAKAEQDAKDRKVRADADAIKTALDKKLVDFNGDLAYYTAALALVAGLQFIALIGQSIVLAVSLKHSARASGAAERSAEVAETALTLTQRAYISAKEYRTEATKDEAGNIVEWKIVLMMENSGNTPAINLRGGMILQELPIGTEVDPFDITSKKNPAKAVVGARTSVTTFEPGKNVVTKAQALRIVSGEINVFLCSTSEYNDIFPGTALHRTSVCMRMSVEDKTFKSPNPFTYNAHHKYNETT